jgi:23S rRNA (uridine2552-2'-O)-methyltransferase
MAGGRHDDRRLSKRVKTGKGRTVSSTKWLQRQLNDPYVAEAKRQGYRSRAAFKIIEIGDKLKLFKPGQRILDLGAAPGGWTQVAVQRVKGGQVLALDINEMDPVVGATVLEADFLAPDAPELVRRELGGPVDVVLSDMAPPATGQRDLDHLKIMALVEAALQFATEVLKPGGAFVSKFLQGSEEQAFFKELRRHFTAVHRIKPPASRSDSSEFFVAGTGFRRAAE